MFQLTEHFSRESFYTSPEAEELGIDNTPPIVLLPYMEKIAWKLEVVWNYFNSPVRIICCFHCQELNTLLGGTSHNRHLFGTAVDFYVENVPSVEVGPYLPILIPEFDHIIIYPGVPDWIHMDFSFSFNRKLVIDRTKK